MPTLVLCRLLLPLVLLTLRPATGLWVSGSLAEKGVASLVSED